MTAQDVIVPRVAQSIWSTSPEERKGLLLSHLIGFCLFAEFTFNFINIEIPFTPPLSIPIRLVAIWLLIDRTGRIGRLRFGPWDWLIWSFVTVTAIGIFINTVSTPQLPFQLE